MSVGEQGRVQGVLRKGERSQEGASEGSYLAGAETAPAGCTDGASRVPAPGAVSGVRQRTEERSASALVARPRPRREAEEEWEPHRRSPRPESVGSAAARTRFCRLTTPHRVLPKLLGAHDLLSLCSPSAGSTVVSGTVGSSATSLGAQALCHRLL